MSRPIRAEISAAALTHNLQVARRFAGSARIWAVIKANAYGHGLERAARALASADGYAVLDLEDAIALRAMDTAKPVLLLEGLFRPADIAILARHSITPVVHTSEQLRMLEQVPPGANAGLEVYLKINTGMNRLGFAPDEAGTAYRALKALSGVRAVTLMTHFSDADGAGGIAAQLARFETVTRELPGARSLANSAALLRFPQSHADWVRPGIMLYGGSPFADQSAHSLGLRPAMTLASELISVQRLRQGDRVGYGSTYEANEAMAIGVVACGYADGYPRHAPNGTPVLVCGKRTGTAGRVSMDMMCVDLRGIDEARVGSPVTLWGEGLPADEVAAAAGTVSYELFCALAARVPVVEKVD